MAMFTVQEILRAAQGALVAGDLAVPVTGVSIDSRTLAVGDAFVAIRGHRLDGHAFLVDAAGRGAACLVVHTLSDDVPVGRDRAHQRRFLLAHTVDRAEELGVDGSDHRHDRDRWLRDRGERGDLAGLIGADLHDERLVLGLETQDRERQAPLIVEARLRTMGAPARSEERRVGKECRL